MTEGVATLIHEDKQSENTNKNENDNEKVGQNGHIACESSIFQLYFSKFFKNG